LKKLVFREAKFCGDAVAAYVPKVLHAIHPKYAAAVKAFPEKTTVNTCRIIAPNEKYIDVTSHETGFITPRVEWDNFLYELSAVEKSIKWFTDHEVTDITIDRALQQATVIANGIRFRSKLVIGCDGAHAISTKN
jgi:2-polyprenyl-6-methoxyphenol hydroxylase-like FAD-dependent oxidoreductase